MLSDLAAGVRVILHCFSMPERIEECLAHDDWWISFAGNVTFPKAPDLRVAALRVPAARLLVETDAPYLAPQVVRGRPNQPAYVADTARRSGRGAPSGVRGARRGGRGERGRGVRVVKLGQNFLVDRNILGVIERLAALEEDDVVLEIGGGEGVLSTRLAALVAHVHVVEVDRQLEQGLRDVLCEFLNVTLWIADALSLELSALDPAPTAVVANLPYSIAATVILRTIEELPSVREWVVMVQREVGERLAASVGDPAYGVPSVLAQLACEVRVLRPVARTVFRPVPRVDSVLVGLRRREGTPGVEPAVRSLVHDAFAHRRKALAGSLALAPDASMGVRERAREALVSMGHPPDERAERCSPAEFRELAARLGGS